MRSLVSFLVFDSIVMKESLSIWKPKTELDEVSRYRQIKLFSNYSTANGEHRIIEKWRAATEASTALQVEGNFILLKMLLICHIIKCHTFTNNKPI